MLTPKAIEAAIKRATTETTLKDSDGTRGGGVLALRIRPSTTGNAATWLAMWTLAGKRGSKALGSYPDVTLAQAREKFAADVRPTLMAGKPPSKLEAMGEGATVEALCKAYVQSLVDNGKRSVEQYRHTLLAGKYNLADKLGRNRLASSIGAEDVAQALKDTDNRGSRRQADIERTTLVAMFNYAIKSTHNYRASSRVDWGVRINPAAMIPRDTGAVVARERNLSAKEMQAVWHAATSDTGGVLRMVMCCGQRVLETLRIEGKDVDLDAALWTMPAAKTKGGKHAHIIPLPRQAVELLRDLVAQYGDGYLFPARAGAAGDHMGIPSVSRGASRMTVCEPFQPRDLRRTWKSRAGEAGVDRFMRDLIQQHAQNDTGSKFYDRQDYLPKMREAMKTWEAWLDANVLTQDAKKAA